ncbi:very short patch repair endonuclease [[Mycobacterium] wendilense]|uniref:Very short patch repair endonuclease n=1 Tax=[Mycobacterium] wendilense TaxID=3064284 RepID=A0ABM9MCG5_9MYCO|nr:very short patch repair endonuclease [Mycolicibacterium sp. MU0050]CAJ1581855.1 very short patch repair endonuclease [Mycolicibacterium sp. MU0050]
MSARPPASSESVRARMSRQRRTGTEPELLVRRILHARGIRYRVDTAPEPGLRCKADIVWRGLRLAVFLDGCFWHGCPIHATRPKANETWWARKLEGNVERDRRTDADLTARGWTVLRFWEHEDPKIVADAICRQLIDLRAGRRPVQITQPVRHGR